MVYCGIKGPPWACLCLHFGISVTSKVANITGFLSIPSQLLLSSNCLEMVPNQVKRPILQFRPIHVPLTTDVNLQHGTKQILPTHFLERRIPLPIPYNIVATEGPSKSMKSIDHSITYGWMESKRKGLN